ncbi:MAG TPA: methyltransferase [Armatimonadota bacterium]|nr:methyltransferase [Armatimonadota bacterium]
MGQNTSSAVMSQRIEPKDSLDFFPTPPWATRALCKHVLRMYPGGSSLTSVWDPACGDGAMVGPLREYFGTVRGSDVADYGVGFDVADFLFPDPKPQVDWIITNPPFRLGREFAETALKHARIGVALLVRTAFLESRDRLPLFTRSRPWRIAQFVERVTMVKGRLDPKASTATAYCWIVWRQDWDAPHTEFVWIPPCRAQLERPEDYR